MSGTIINLIIQLIAGAIGGNAVGAAAKECESGNRRNNTIAGALGGAGWRVAPDLAHPDAARGHRRHGHRLALVGQLVGGGAGPGRSSRRSSAWS